MADLKEVYSATQLKSFPAVKICNIEEQQKGNKKIYSRSLPVKGYHTNSLDFRSTFKVCSNYKDMNTVLNDRTSLQKNYSNNIVTENTLRFPKTEKNPQNKRNNLVAGDNYLKQLLYTIKPHCTYSN